MSELPSSALCTHCGRLVPLRSRSGIYASHPIDPKDPYGKECYGSDLSEQRTPVGVVPRALQRSVLS